MEMFALIVIGDNQIRIQLYLHIMSMSSLNMRLALADNSGCQDRSLDRECIIDAANDADGVLSTQLCSAYCFCSAGLFRLSRSGAVLSFLFFSYEELVSGVSVEQYKSLC